MSELTAVSAVDAAAAQKYADLVAEAFIKPIRTVIAVDDEFPSLDSSLALFVNDGKPWSGSREMAMTVQKLLVYCRNRQTPWLVDVHDGASSDPSSIAIPQLHQSDLIILDYHLGPSDDGTKAQMLLRALAKHAYFNMAVVYTKGNQDGIRGVFWEVVAALTSSDWKGGPDATRVDKADRAIKNWEDLDPDAYERLKNMISIDLYLNERASAGSARRTVFAAVEAIVKEAPAQIDLRATDAFEWLLNEAHRDTLDLLSNETLGSLRFAFDTNGVNWIQTDRLFITVVDKQQEPDTIETFLINALIQSAPSPLHLLMARMRWEVEARGADAQGDVLGDPYLYAGWLDELFASSHSDRRKLLNATVDRHWSALGHSLRSNIDGYAGKVVDHAEVTTKEQLFQQYVPKAIQNQPDKISAHLNSYNCSMPIDRAHLTTGQVFQFESQEGNEYWICMSPACDLVPGQKSSGWFGRLGASLPFIAVRLVSSATPAAAQQATMNNHLFLKVGSEVKAFSFYPNGDPSLNPLWELMFAGNQGRFIDGTNSIEVRRASDIEGALTISQPRTVSVVAQLRYQYALSLLQRLGNMLSRVGLDFRAQPIAAGSKDS